MGVSRDLLSDWLTVIAAARLSELSDEQNNEINSILIIWRFAEYSSGRMLE